MVLALNMMDEVRENGGSIRVNEMEAMLGVLVVPISAAKGEGIDELVSHALHVAHYQERPGRPDFCDPEGPQAAVHRCLHGIMHLIEDHAEKAGILPRFAASKLAEGDRLVLEQLNLSETKRRCSNTSSCRWSRSAGWIAPPPSRICVSPSSKRFAARPSRPHESHEHARSVKADRILTENTRPS